MSLERDNAELRKALRDAWNAVTEAALLRQPVPDKVYQAIDKRLRELGVVGK